MVSLWQRYKLNFQEFESTLRKLTPTYLTVNWGVSGYLAAFYAFMYLQWSYPSLYRNTPLTERWRKFGEFIFYVGSDEEYQWEIPIPAARLYELVNKHVYALKSPMYFMFTIQCIGKIREKALTHLYR